MIQKKVCMLGAFAVGKTSLVSRFVRSIFSDKYLTTVGVKIDKKIVTVGSQQVNLILWDLHGEDEFQKIRMSYLRGSAGYVLVVDGTRPATLDQAVGLQGEVEGVLGPVPFVLALNKSDLTEAWNVDSNKIGALHQQPWAIIETSAKDGRGVQEAFTLLTERILESH
jgi:hypothetical protein